MKIRPRAQHSLIAAGCRRRQFGAVSSLTAGVLTALYGASAGAGPDDHEVHLGCRIEFPHWFSPGALQLCLYSRS